MIRRACWDDVAELRQENEAETWKMKAAWPCGFSVHHISRYT